MPSNKGMCWLLDNGRLVTKCRQVEQNNKADQHLDVLTSSNLAIVLVVKYANIGPGTERSSSNQAWVKVVVQ